MRGWAGLLATLTLWLPACGDDLPAAKEAGQASAPPGWSAPRAAGDPEGGELPVDADAALARLRERVRDGTAAADAGWEVELRVATELLFDVAKADEGVRVHLDVVRTAADVARWLREGPDARARVAREQPTDLSLHDAFLAEGARGAQHYRDWCRADGAELLRRHAEARRAQLFGER